MELILRGVAGFFVVTSIRSKYFTRPTVLFNPLAVMTEVGFSNSFQESSSHPSAGKSTLDWKFFAEVFFFFAEASCL